MSESLSFLFSGSLLGLAAGISPGPMLALVISETVKHNRKAGIVVASVPILTDFPIILLSLIVLTKLPQSNLILGAISFTGALFIAYMAYESITAKGVELNLKSAAALSLKKGIMTNLLSPHPYLFWMSVGGPAVIKGYSINPLSAAFFILGFYMFLIGSKVAAALIVDRFKSFLKSNIYIYIIKTLGFILLIFSLLYVRDGLKLLGII
jgi:threonine/homoserine/homoserine lactone efflux protein